MTEIINIGDKAVEMRADGATPFLYKQAFSKDLIKIFSDATEGADIVAASEMASELGFVMAQQAKSPDPLNVNLSKGEFMKWLSQFEPLDLATSSIDIINLYIGTYKTDSTAKKKDDFPTEN